MKKAEKSSAVEDLHSEVDEVKNIMIKNIDQILERGERLNELMDRAEILESSSREFHDTSRKVKRKMWWQNLKMKIIIGVVVSLLLIIIICVILYSMGVFSPSSSSKPIEPTKAPTM